MNAMVRVPLIAAMFLWMSGAAAHAQECRANPQASAGTQTVGNCPGEGAPGYPHSTIPDNKKYNMSADTLCQWNNYYSKSQSGTKTVTANAMCNAGAGIEPQCRAAFDGPFTTSSFAMWTATYKHATYSESTASCGLGTEQSESLFLPVEGCAGSFCCSAAAEQSCQEQNGLFNGQGSCLCGFSPIIISMDANGIHLTNANDGVDFDLVAQGRVGRWGWTNAGANDAFLVLDRDGDGLINNGKELFGSVTEQPPSSFPRNGFNALKAFDGNSDDRIDVDDPVYGLLRLWFDRNHNAISAPSELVTLADAGLLAISLDYRETSRVDAAGNAFRFASAVWIARNHSTVRRIAWDVFLTGR